MQEVVRQTYMQDFGYYKTYKNFLTLQESEHLSKVILRDEEEIKRIPINENDHTDWELHNPHGLTQYHTVYNWLNHPDFIPLDLPTRIHNLPEFKNKPITIQCWGNILRQGERLEEHTHGNETTTPFYALNIFLSGNTQTGTYYYDAREYTPNEVGELHVISSDVSHGVNTHLFQEPRISIAMDVYTDATQIQEQKDLVRQGRMSGSRFIHIS